MKTKVLSLLALLIVITLSANAQYKKFILGLKAAPQIAWMKPNLDNYDNGGARLGFSWGFVSEFGLTENHSVATGFNVLFNGGKLDFPTLTNDSVAGNMSRTYYVKTIEIPLTLKMRTNAIGDFKYYGQIGFGTSFRFNSKDKDEFTPTANLPKTTTDKQDYDKIAFLRESLIVGFGAEYTPGDGPTFSAGLALNNGFTNILKDTNTLTGKKEKATLSFIELNLAVLF